MIKMYECSSYCYHLKTVNRTLIDGVAVGGARVSAREKSLRTWFDQSVHK